MREKKTYCRIVNRYLLLQEGNDAVEDLQNQAEFQESKQFQYKIKTSTNVVQKNVETIQTSF